MNNNRFFFFIIKVVLILSINLLQINAIPIADPTSIFRFIIISNGTPYYFNCGAGTAFNPSISVCDYTANVVAYYYSIGLRPPGYSSAPPSLSTSITVILLLQVYNYQFKVFLLIKFINHLIINIFRYLSIRLTKFLNKIIEKIDRNDC
jgi:hypothetical protein